MLDKELALKHVEQIARFSLSDEQTKILKSNWNDNVVVNACAGAGKTTIMILRLLYQEMITEEVPAHWLCVTFSRLAQNDMLSRYRELKNRLIDELGVELSTDEPSIRTIHAMAYELAQASGVIDSDAFIVDSFSPYYKELVDLIEALSPQSKYNSVTAYNAYTTWRATGELPSGVINVRMKRLHNEYTRIKNEHHAIDFADMIDKLTDYVKENPDQVITQSLTYYTHILIDEFQDIDMLQWQLVNALFPEQVKSKLTIIGDLNQNIYSFRGSLSSIMQDMTTKNMVYDLRTNYRTAEKILTFAQKALGKPDTSIAFNKNGIIEQSLLNDLNFNEIINENNTTALLSRYRSSLARVKDKLLFASYAVSDTKHYDYFTNSDMWKMTVDILLSLRTNDIELFIKGARFLGFQTFENQVSQYHRQTNGSLIDYFTKGGVHLNEKMFNAQQNKKRIVIVEELLDIAKKIDKESINTLLKRIKKLCTPYLMFIKAKHQAKYTSLTDDFSYILTKFTGVNDFKSFELLVKSFNERWDNHSIGKQKIETLTVHQAKGLEFDTVLLTDILTFKNMISTPYDYKMSATDIDEERRIMYVALTRARHRLQLIL